VKILTDAETTKLKHWRQRQSGLWTL